MRINLLLLLVIPAFLICCAQQVEKMVKKAYSDGSPELEYYYKVSGGDSVLVREVGYYPGGIRQIEGTYEDNLREGTWRYWYENGNLWVKAEYQKDLRDGLCEVWHDNGQIYYSGSYRKGERTGVWKFWDARGVLIKEINYSE